MFGTMLGLVTRPATAQQRPVAALRIAPHITWSMDRLANGFYWGESAQWEGARIGLPFGRRLWPQVTFGHAELGIVCLASGSCDHDGWFVAPGVEAIVARLPWLALSTSGSLGLMGRTGEIETVLLIKAGLRFIPHPYARPFVDLGFEDFPVVDTNPALSVGLEILIPVQR